MQINTDISTSKDPMPCFIYPAGGSSALKRAEKSRRKAVDESKSLVQLAETLEAFVHSGSLDALVSS